MAARYVTPSSPFARPAGWPPVGSAFVASGLLHALAIAALGLVIVQPAAAPKIAPAPLQAVILRSPEPVPESAIAPPVPPPVLAKKASAPPAVAARPPPEKAAPAAPPAPAALPWAGAYVDTSPPPGFWSNPQPMVDAGVEVFEASNRTQLGEQVERRIQAGFPVAPAQPIRLRAPDVIGYPLDALEAGIEGRVFIWIGVNELGKVTDVEVLDGPSELTDWVIARVGRLIERPALDRKGEAMPGWIALDFAFSREAALAARAAQDAAPPVTRAGRTGDDTKPRDAN